MNLETTNAIELSEDQVAALDAFERAFDDPSCREFKLGGLAGTGKTTLVRFVLERMTAREIPFLPLAPTAKACVALARRGTKAQTIHQAIYAFKGARVEGDGIDRRVTLDFVLKEKQRESALDRPRRRGLVVVDESSMVGAREAGDLRALAPFLLWVGDHGQLMPVGPDPAIMSALDAKLERVHRQAAGSPIVRLAHVVRAGVSLASAARGVLETADDYEPEQVVDGGVLRPHGVRLRGCWNAYGLDLVAAEVAREIGAEPMVIVARNETRRAFNAQARKRIFKSDALPPLVVGERLVGLKNCYPRGFFNGEEYVVREVGAMRDGDAGSEVEAVLVPDEGEPFLASLWVPTLGRGTQGNEVALSTLPTRLCVADYAYARTAHKAQGSEAEAVVVFDEPVNREGWDMSRWRYTAATRARSLLVIASREA